MSIYTYIYMYRLDSSIIVVINNIKIKYNHGLNQRRFYNIMDSTVSV